MFFGICEFLWELYEELLEDRLASQKTYINE
jgi:hypothetical protein